MSKELVFTVRDTGQPPEEEDRIIRLLEKAADEAVHETQRNVEFRLLPEELPRK